MIVEYRPQFSAAQALHSGPPRLVNESLKESVVRFCLTRQHDRAPATVSGVIDFLSAQGVTVDRFWVRNFVQREKQQLCHQTARVLEKDRGNVSPDDIKQYFETLSVHIRLITSAFVWSAGETRDGCPKKASPPEVIVAINTQARSVAIPEAPDDAQLTLLTAISAFGDSSSPLFISKRKTFEKTFLAAQELYAGHCHVIRSTPKAFITELFFTDLLENIFLPRISELRIKSTCDGPCLLIFNRYSTARTARVITLSAA
jgi:hypothetical protein